MRTIRLRDWCDEYLLGDAFDVRRTGAVLEGDCAYRAVRQLAFGNAREIRYMFLSSHSGRAHWSDREIVEWVASQSQSIAGEFAIARWKRQTLDGPVPARRIEEPSVVPDATTWIAIELVDEAGSAMANVRFEMNFANGGTRTGTTDAAGRARVENLLSGGACEVTFPSLTDCRVEAE